MIKAEHKRWARLLFNPYIDRQLRKSFSNFYLVNEIPAITENASLLATPNHISWWDGFFIDFVNRKKFNRSLHIMMLESSLKKYWFFSKLGAYSINPADARAVLETARYTGTILKDSRNIVITYPQGEIEPFEKRPLNIKEGIRIFLKNSPGNTKVLPIAFRIEYENRKQPAVYCRFGDMLNADDVVENYKDFAALFTDNLDKLSEAVHRKSFVGDLFL